MDREQYERVRELFHAAVDVEVSERASFLERACAGDAALRAEIDSLLDARDRAAPFLEGDLVLEGDPTATRPPSPLLGRIVGRCEVVREIAAGGMGTVYEAVQDEPRRRVALKILRPSAVGRESLARFRHEVEALGRLSHPAIAQVYEAGTHEDAAGPIAYFTMELVAEATSLTGYAVSKRLAIPERLALFLRVCVAVSYAHQRGVIHRDLKPSNIVVDAEGQPKVLDFGIAKITSSDLAPITLQTRAGELLGTLSYMSPEQVVGDAKGINERCDVYALGVILYELLADRLPIDTATSPLPEALRRVGEEDPPPLGSIHPSLRGDLESIAAKALEKKPARRYASVSAMAADVERFLRHEPVSARPISTLYSVRKFARRHRALVVGGSSAVVALTLGLGIAVWQAVTATRARNELGREQVRSRMSEYVASLAAAEAALRSGDATEAAGFLEAAPAELRDWEWWELRARLDPSERTLGSVTGGTAAIAASPKDPLLVAIGNGKLLGFDTRDWSTSWIVNGEGRSSTALAISRDGRRLVSIGPQGAATWTLDPSGPPRFLARAEIEAGATAAVFAADDRTVWIASKSGKLASWGGEILRTLPWRADGSIRSLATSADGRFVAVCTSKGAAVLDANGEESGSFPDGTGAVDAAAFGPGSATLATAGVDHAIRWWALEAGRPVRRISEGLGHTAEITSLQFAPDGGTLVSSSADRSVRVWTPERGSAALCLTGHRARVLEVAVLPDGRVVSTSDDTTIRVWNLAAMPPRSIPGCSAVFAPDGAVYSVDKGRRWRWRLADGGVPKELPRSDLDEGLGFGSSQCGERILVGGLNARANVQLFDVEDGNPVAAFGCGPGADWKGSPDLAFSRDGLRLAVPLPDGAGRVLDREGHVIAEWKDTGAQHVHPTFSPDGARIATLSTGGSVIVRDAATGVPVLVLRGHGSDARCVEFSPDGSLLATGSLDHTARLWDAATGRCLRVLVGHKAQIESLTFTPSGSRLATGSFDGTVRLWDVGLGRCVTTLRTDADAVALVRFSPDGSCLLAVPDGRHQDGEPRIGLWHAGSEARRLAQGSLEEALLPDAAAARLEGIASLPRPLKEEAIRIARTLRPDAALYNAGAWEVVASLGVEASACERARRLAEAACALEPSNGFFLNTLGAAQYRCGRFDEALKTLERADRMNGGIPPDLAFLVMCRSRLGDLDRARADLDRLRACFATSWGGGEPRALANEAQGVYEGCLVSPDGRR